MDKGIPNEPMIPLDSSLVACSAPSDDTNHRNHKLKDSATHVSGSSADAIIATSVPVEHVSEQDSRLKPLDPSAINTHSPVLPSADPPRQSEREHGGTPGSRSSSLGVPISTLNVPNATGGSTTERRSSIDPASIRNVLSRTAHNIFGSGRSASTGSAATFTKEEKSRDWLFMSIITIIVSLLDKGFDLKFLINLEEEGEWVFMSLSGLFIVLSTVITSLLAAQR